jgi:catechol 2,3-dioxygenase-like lactoylglutathione lyase family enzyme
MSFRAISIIPILRIFSIEKAREFYVDYLGFHLDWEHRFEPDLPLYMQVSRDGLVLHLSEHYGDGSPGSHFHIDIEGVRELHAELAAKNYGYLRPGLENDSHWGTVQLCLIDPFGNKLDFGERKQKNDAAA